MSSSRIVHGACSDASTEAELNTLAAVYKFLLETHAKKNPAARPSVRGKDGTKIKEDSANVFIIRR